MAKICILGAGICGLTAALKLSKMHEVIVLEARNRVGGRVYTKIASDLKTPIEIGASFWEGIHTHPLYQRFFGTQKNHENLAYAIKLDESQTIFFGSGNKNCQEISPLALKLSYLHAQQFLEDSKQFADKASLIHAKQLIDKYALLNSTAGNIDLVKMWLALTQRHHATPLSARYLPHFEKRDQWEALEMYSTDADFCFVANGYEKVPIAMASQCAAMGVNIKLNAKVLHIQDKAEQGVFIRTSNGEFQADYCICTLPLGVLKANNHLFSPDLSHEKQNALALMGLHDATRVILEFETPFWQANAPYILLDLPPFGLRAFRSNYMLHQKAILQTDNYADFANKLFQRYVNHPQLAEDKLIEVIMTDLRKAFPRAPNPIQAVVYSWSNDPFAKGAYPYWTAKVTQQTQSALESAHGNIYFAGADYSRIGCSVHNAYASGLRVALEVGL